MSKNKNVSKRYRNGSIVVTRDQYLDKTDYCSPGHENPNDYYRLTVIVDSNNKDHLVLVPFGLEYLKLAVFILVIATFVQLVEFFTKKYMPSLYKALGVYLPLITTNCVVLQVCLDLVSNEYNLLQTIVYSASIAVGYMLIIVIFSHIRTRLDNQEMPKAFKGSAIALITAGLMAMAFYAFSGFSF